MTIRTNAALQTLFADNTTGAISPQDLRDFLDSIMGVYGGVLITSGVTGQVLVAATPEQLTEWTADGESNGATPAFASNQITIDNAGVYAVFFQISFEGITGSTFDFSVYKNGSPLSPVIDCERKTANTDVGSASMTAHLTLAAADVLTIEVESSGNGTMVALDAHFLVNRIG